MINHKILVMTSVAACFIACLGDFIATFVLGAYYPGYSQLHHTMSFLGASASPVSGIISAWWVILGLLIIVFALGFNLAFDRHNRYVQIATWLLIFYGLGEGLGSGLFKADHVNNALTISGIIHEFLGSIGVISILALPLVMKKIIQESTNPGFRLFSNIIFFAGIALLVMFLFRFLGDGHNPMAIYKGLWQRLFVFDYYIYLMTIAIIMIKKYQL